MSWLYIYAPLNPNVELATNSSGFPYKKWHSFGRYIIKSMVIYFKGKNGPFWLYQGHMKLGISASGISSYFHRDGNVICCWRSMSQRMMR